jgi:hypothetical protein
MKTLFHLFTFAVIIGTFGFLVSMISSMMRKLYKIQQLGIKLYTMGYWKAEGISQFEAAAVWADFRNELGIDKGTATALGVGDPHGEK